MSQMLGYPDQSRHFSYQYVNFLIYFFKNSKALK